jgi:hypothetical protein
MIAFYGERRGKEKPDFLLNLRRPELTFGYGRREEKSPRHDSEVQDVG